jgi:hypothetical protein
MMAEFPSESHLVSMAGLRLLQCGINRSPCPGKLPSSGSPGTGCVRVHPKGVVDLHAHMGISHVRPREHLERDNRKMALA